MYESVVSTAEDSVVYAEISGFVEKKFRVSADYLFVVEVMWTDHRTTYIKRTYKDFCKFHRRLTDHFFEKYEKGILKTPIFIPKINGAWLFQRATRDLAEKREEELHSFLQQLLQGNPLIACNHIVVQFFQSRSTDPVSSMNTLNSTSEVEEKDGIACNNDSEDEDRDGAWPWPFQRASRELAEKREAELHNFLKQLLQGNPMVASNKIVVDFFLSRPSDPVPYRGPPDGAASDKHFKDIISDDELDDENEDDILFER